MLADAATCELGCATTLRRWWAVAGLALLWSGVDPRVREGDILARGSDQIPEPEPGT